MKNKNTKIKDIKPKDLKDHHMPKNFDISLKALREISKFLGM